MSSLQAVEHSMKVVVPQSYLKRHQSSHLYQSQGLLTNGKYKENQLFS